MMFVFILSSKIFVSVGNHNQGITFNILNDTQKPEAFSFGPEDATYRHFYHPSVFTFAHFKLGCNEIIYKIIIIKLNELVDTVKKVARVPNKLTNIVFKYPTGILSYV